MLKQSLKVASTFMATNLALAVTASDAKAINFTFSFDTDIQFLGQKAIKTSFPREESQKSSTRTNVFIFF